MKSRFAQPGAMVGLIKRLDGLGVELTKDVAASADQLLRLPTLMDPPIPPPPDLLLGMSDDEMRAELRQMSVAAAVRSGGLHVLRDMQVALAAAVGNALVDETDSILDQLRPRFDEAAATMHHATELGIHAGTSDRDILNADDVAAHRDAWTEIPAATRVLEAIATARIALSTVAGAPPATSRASFDEIIPTATVHSLASAMFRTDLVGYHQDGEDAWQRWLRLCAGQPATLLPAEASVEAGEAAARARVVQMQEARGQLGPSMVPGVA